MNGPVIKIMEKLAEEVKNESKQKAKKPLHIAEVVRHGKQFVIPEGISYPDAIDLLKRKMTSEEEVTEIRESIDAFVWDGALALTKAMNDMFGWFQPEVTKTFFGDKPPAMISVEVGVGKTELVPWGQFSIPGMEGRIGTSAMQKDGRIVFVVTAMVKRKDEPAIRAVIELARKYVREQSIYKGGAIKMRFKDNEGEALEMPEPKFLDLSRVDEGQLIYSQEVMSAVSTNLFTPVEQVEACRRHKIPLKRGVLLSGPYGTGKTLAAYVTAKKCERNGWTFLYCERADELADMVKFAHHYQPAVIFCEDIDRVMEGDRSTSMDDILNIVDGIESKNTEIMVILTTNHVEKINPALLRPGRLDAVINVLPPDAEAVERLVRLYGGDLIPENANLKAVGEQLAGKIPAVVRECIERAKLSALKLGNGALVLTPESIMDAAVGMKNQLDLLKPKDVATLREKVERAVGKVLTQGANLDAQVNGQH